MISPTNMKEFYVVIDYNKNVSAVISAVGGLKVGISGFEQGDSSFLIV